jgi:NAD(P)-dependent dehydrogenase (short-subunit alcohol dehydrogenase family)
MIGSGRVAVITGAAQGIGKRTSERLAERGTVCCSTICVPRQKTQLADAHLGPMCWKS